MSEPITRHEGFMSMSLTHLWHDSRAGEWWPVPSLIYYLLWPLWLWFFCGGVWVHPRFDLFSVYVICLLLLYLVTDGVCDTRLSHCLRADHSTQVCFIILLCYGIICYLGSWQISDFPLFYNFIVSFSLFLFFCPYSVPYSFRFDLYRYDLYSWFYLYYSLLLLLVIYISVHWAF